MLCFVPIYGTRNAGCGLWRKIERVLPELGCAENYIFSAVHSFNINDVVIIMTLVDDMLWASELEYQQVTDSIKERLKLGGGEQTKFRNCCDVKRGSIEQKSQNICFRKKTA